LTPDEWTACKQGVLSAFSLGKDNRYHQGRLRSEYQNFIEQNKKRSEAAKIAAKSRWKDANGMRDASQSQCDRNANLCHSDSESNNNISIPRAREDVVNYGKTIECPEQDAISFWNHFQSQGWVKSNGLPLTDWRARLEAWKQDQVRKRFSSNAGTNFRDIQKPKLLTDEDHARGF
jgi:hypothetical protein